MREGWRVVRLGELCRLHYGKALRDADRWGGEVPVVGSAGQFASHSVGNAMTDSGTIVVGRKGSAGSVTWFDRPAWVTDTAYWAEPTETLTLSFLFLLLQHADLPSVCAQTGVPGLNRDRAYDISVLLPAPEEQRRIVDLVGALDDTIAAAERLKARLSATLAKRRDMAFAVRDARPASEMFDILIGLQRSPARAEGPNQTRYLRSANVTHGRLILDDVKTMSFDEKQRIKYGVEPGDVLVSEGSASADAVGAPSKYQGELDGPVCFQNTLLRYRAMDSVTTPEFVSQWCSWAYESGAFREAANGTNIKHIGSGGACKMMVATVPLEDQPALTDELHAAQSAVEHAGSTVGTLRHLRSNLLTALLSGEHEIPESYDELMEAVG